MGLVYSTLLSLVPLLAVSFSVLKAFGAHELIRPTLAEALAPLGPQGAEITTRVVQFVDNIEVGVQARRGRSLMRKFSDYLSLLLVGPVLV
jgi:membrane protein